MDAKSGVVDRPENKLPGAGVFLRDFSPEEPALFSPKPRAKSRGKSKGSSVHLQLLGEVPIRIDR
jgi:hypothetical protein